MKLIAILSVLLQMTALPTFTPTSTFTFTPSPPVAPISASTFTPSPTYEGVVAAPPAFVPQYDLYPVGATLDEVGQRTPRRAPAKSGIYYADGEWHSQSGEWTEAEKKEWDKWYHHYDFVHWGHKALWFVFTPQEYAAYKEWQAQRDAWDATHNYANGDRPYKLLPVGDALAFVALLCGAYVWMKVRRHKAYAMST